MLVTILVAVLIISGISVIGILLLFKKHDEHRDFRSLISLAAGSLLAVSFLDVIPEALEGAEGVFEPHLISGVILLSILVFFLFERVLHWHHCADEFHPHLHEHDHQRKGLIALNLVGDSIHNFIDGFLVAGAFMLDFGTGVTVTIAVILHEIPQEISDFGILLYSGLSRAKALVYNFLTALTAVAGALIFYVFGTSVELAIPLMGAMAAGNFIYLAIADLIPELYNEKNRTKIFIHTVWLLIGVGLIYAVTILIPHGNG